MVFFGLFIGNIGLKVEKKTKKEQNLHFLSSFLGEKVHKTEQND